MLQFVLPAGALTASSRYVGFSLTSTTSLLTYFVLVRNWQWISQTWPSSLRGIGIITSIVASVSILYLSRTFTGLFSHYESLDDGKPRVLFFPSRTAHTRFIPQRHSFAHSYLLVGIPVGWKGTIGGLISVEQGNVESGKSGKSTWFSVDASEYLERGSHLDLRGKLDKYLQSQGHLPANFPHAYLFTAPKFLGYFNNPVSFWYLYDDAWVLTGMILEVNNTFDERRMYFLTPSRSTSELEHVDPSAKSQTPTTFSQTWSKDFHVSPFSSRKGSYTLNTYDPITWSDDKFSIPKLSATITLVSSKSEKKLVARVFSDGPSFDPSTSTPLRKLEFVFHWWWIIYVTFPRVAYEAGKLFFKRGLYVWARPEPHKTTISRSATTSELALEAAFRTYLQWLVESCDQPLSVSYVPSGVKNVDPATFRSPSTKAVGSAGKNGDIKSMTIKVLTPAFYTRFIHYAHDLEAFFSESHESNTLHIENANLLSVLVCKKPHSKGPEQPRQIDTLVDHLLLRALRALRKRPDKLEAVSYIGKPVEISPVKDKTSSSKDLKKSKDLRTFRNSSMDAFFYHRSLKPKDRSVSGHDVDSDVLDTTQVKTDEFRTYAVHVLKALVSDYIALGDVGILEFEWWGVKVVGIWLISSFLVL